MANCAANTEASAPARRSRDWLGVSRSGLRLFASMLLLVGATRSAPAQILQLANQTFPLTQLGQSNTQNVTLNVNSPVVLTSIQIAPNYPEYAFNSITGCTYSTLLTAGTACTLSITFTPLYPGHASSPVPIGRAAPLQITYVDQISGAIVNAGFALSGTGTGPVGILSPGLISDLAGNDVTLQSGFAGDGGPASGAAFNSPSAIALDELGNLYIADTGNSVVRRVDAVTHVVSTVAGIAPSTNPYASNAGPGVDGVPATQSPLNRPAGIALDGAGNLYIADTNNQAVRMVAAGSGIITTVAGTLNDGGSPGCCFSGDGGPATLAQLYFPAGITVDGSGNLFIADSGNNAVRRVDSLSGNIATVAGGPANLSSANHGDGGLATAAQLNAPISVMVDSVGDIFISDSLNNEVRRVDSVTGIITSLYQATGSPGGLAVDASDNIYFTLPSSCLVLQFNPTMNFNLSPGPSTVVSGSGSCFPSGDGGPATSAGLNVPQAVALNGLGDLYILERDGVRFVNSSQSELLFGPVTAGSSSPVQTTFLSDGDIVNLQNIPASGATTTGLASTQTIGPELSAPFFIAPYTGQNGTFDCGNAEYTLAPGQTCGVSIYFQPTANGTFSDVAAYMDNSYPALNGYGGAQTIQLAGSATATPPAVTLSASQLIFSTAQGTASAAQTLTLTNSSPTSVSIAAISIVGISASAFSQTNTCGAMLAADSSCAISIIFNAPAGGNSTSNPQTFSAVIGVVDSATNSPQTAVLTGTILVTLPPINLSIVETLHLSDAVTATPSTLLNIAEAIHLSDAIGLTPSTLLNIAEIIHTSDSPKVTPSTLLNLSETIHLTDAVIPTPSTQLNIAETIHTSDTLTALTPSTILQIAETIHTSDGAPGLIASTELTIAEAIHVTDAISAVPALLTPVITWPAPASIVYDTPLSAKQLDATASVAGTFTYSPGVGTVLPAGIAQLTATFVPTNTSVYANAFQTVQLTVNRAAQVITFRQPASPVMYGGVPITLSGSSTSGLPVIFSVLSGPASVSGSALTITGVGTVVVAANQPGNTNYAAASQETRTVTVTQAAQAIKFTQPRSPVAYAAAPIMLSATGGASSNPVLFSVLSGPASIDGDILTVTGVGTIVVAANEAGNADYEAAAQVTRTIVVNQATPAITWTAPAAITYGTALSTAQLDATSTVAGTFAYTPVAGTVLTAGSQTLSVIFTPTDSADYTTAAKSVQLTVKKATPTIAWTAPPAVTYGIALSSVQLNASSAVNGTFTYTPAVGTVLSAGSQTLSVTFTPADTGDYNTATETVRIMINKAAQTINFSQPPATVTLPVAPITLSATSTSGLVVTFSVQSGPASVAGNTLTIAKKGTIVVAAKQAGNANYQAAPQVTWSIMAN